MEKKLRLIADGVELDMFDDTKVNISYSIEDILNLETRRSEYSRDFNLPGTKKNKEFFNNIHETNIDLKRSFLVGINAQLYVGDKTIIVGTLRLIRSQNLNDRIIFQVQITGRFRDFMTELSKLNVDDIDLSDLNHVRNLPTILNSFNNVSGFVYPYILNGQSNDVSSKAFTWDMYPAVFLKEITDRIFSRTGFTVDSKFLESDYFKSLIIPWNKDTIQDVDLDKRICDVGVTGVPIDHYDGSGISTTTDYVPLTPIRQRATPWWGSSNSILGRIRLTDTSTIDFRDDLSSWNIINVGFIPPPVGSFEAGQWRCKANGFYNIRFTGFVFPQYFHAFSTGTIRYNDSKFGFEYNYRLVVIRKNGSILILDQTNGTQFFNSGSKTLQNGEIDLDQNPPNLQPWRLSADNVFFEEDDRIQVQYSFRFPSLNFAGNNNDISVRLVMKRDFGGEFSRLTITPSENRTFGNELVNMNAMLPEDLSLKDMFLDIIKMFNLIIAPDKLNPNSLIIEPREDYWSSRQRIKYWEPDGDSNISVNPMSNINFNRYSYKYKEDSDYLNDRYKNETGKLYGNRLINITNDYSEAEQTTQLQVFSPTPLTNSWTVNRIVPIFAQKEENNLRYKNTNLRILFYKGLKPCQAWTITDSNAPNSGQTLIEYPYAGPFDDPIDPQFTLNFGTVDKLYHPQNAYPRMDLFNKFHRSTFEQAIDKNNRLVEAFFPLTSEDIADLDYRDLILIDGGLHRINQIIDYNPNELTKVQLYKINLTETYDLGSITIPISNFSCPNDIQSTWQDQKDGSRLYFYQSASGERISEDCCNSIGGVYGENGVCYISRPPKPGPTVGEWDPVRDIDYGDRTPIINIRPFSDLRDLNAINRVGTIVEGTDNYVSNRSRSTAVIGRGISSLVGSENAQAFGEGVIADRKGFFYMNDIAVDPDGDIVNTKPYIIHGGKNTTLPASRSNVVEIVHGGKNAARNSGGDVKKRVIISENVFEFGTARQTTITNRNGIIQIRQQRTSVSQPFLGVLESTRFSVNAILDIENLYKWDFTIPDNSLLFNFIDDNTDYYVQGDETLTWSVFDEVSQTINFTFSSISTTCAEGRYTDVNINGDVRWTSTVDFFLCGRSVILADTPIFDDGVVLPTS